MRRALALGVLLAAVAVAGCGPKKGEVKPMQELQDFTPTLEIHRVWSAQAGRGSDASGVRMQAAVTDAAVYLASADGYLKALARSSGRTLWQKTRPWRPARAEAFAGGPAVDDELLVVATLDGKVLAFAAADGSDLWRTQVDASVLSTPVLVDDLVLVRGDNGKVTALHRADGSRAWVYDQGLVPALSLRGNGALIAAHGVIFFGSDDGKLVALHADTGEPLWDLPLAQSTGRTEVEQLNDADGKLVLSGTTLYASAYHGHLTAVDARTGEALWDTPFSTYGGIAAEGTTLVGSDDASVVWAWDARSGTNLWKQAGLEGRWLSPPATQDGYTIFGDSKGWVHWLSLADGRFAGRARLRHDPVIAAPQVLDNDQVLVVDARGAVALWQVERL